MKSQTLKRMGMLTALTAALGLGFVGQAAAQAAPDLKRAEKIVNGNCFLCHGKDGEATSEMFPRLAGQHAQYMAKQLDNFKTGKRTSTAMADMVKDLAPEDFISLGAYFEKKPMPKEESADKDLAGVGKYIYMHGNRFSGVPACSVCHGAQGLGTSTLPRLAGQNAAYTEAQLKQFNKRERNNDNAVMHSVASKLTELEIRAVAEFLHAF